MIADDRLLQHGLGHPMRLRRLQAGQRRRNASLRLGAGDVMVEPTTACTRRPIRRLSAHSQPGTSRNLDHSGHGSRLPRLRHSGATTTVSDVDVVLATSTSLNNCGAAPRGLPVIVGRAGHGHPACPGHHRHQESLLLATHVNRGFFGPDRGLQASFHRRSEIMRLV